MPGVQRRMLDRIGDEVARATSLVRYDPGSAFSAHTHTGGEEFLVLDGVFQDEHGDFPVGSYVRNPPGSSHTPGSEPGVTIFVKLWQFQPSDLQPVSLRPQDLVFEQAAHSPGVSSAQLFRSEFEWVRLERWDAHTTIHLEEHLGMEVLVVDGSFEEAGESFTRHSWLRLPQGQALQALAGDEGAYVWIKQDHLPHVRRP